MKIIKSMKRIAFLSRILATSILWYTMTGMEISAKPAMSPKQEKSGNRLGEEIKRIRRQADSILEKEDDAEQKVILLLQNEKISEEGKKKSDAAKIAVLHSLSAQSLLEYYRRFGFGIGESDFAKLNIQQAIPDYSRLENWRFNDFKQEILQQLEASRQTAFSEPDRQLLYGDLAILDSNRNTYCPDLKEILCHRALQILRDMEGSGLLQEKERIEKTEEVYRYLENHIACKRGDDSLQARFDLELRYLYYRHNSRLCNGKEYEEQLSELASRYKDLPNAGDALYLLACLKKDDAPFIAERYAREAMDHKGCWGAEKSKELLRSLLSPALNISTASVQLPYQAVPLSVEEKNCAGFDYQIYRLPEEEVVNYQFCHDPKKFTDKLTSKSKPASSGHIDLPITNENLQMHSGTVALPALAPGFYLLKVQTEDIRYKGNDSSFQAKELSSILFFQVSQTAFFCYPEKEQKWNGLLLDRKSGLPLKDLSVEAFFVDYDYTKKSNCLQLRYSTQTDKNGFFQIDSTAMQEDEPYTRLMLRFIKDSDTLWFERYSRLTLNRPYQDPRNTRKDTSLWTKVQDIFFFNNLPVYRPGDSLLIKALVVLKEGETSFIATDFPVPLAVTLRNPDGEWQGGGQFSVNRNGIAHIALQIPQDAKAGQWTVQTAGYLATCFIEVENYKRANFSVELAGPSSVNARDSCIVTGKAMYFSGEAVRAASANYRLYASTSFFRPNPYSRRYPHPRELITQGHANTNNNGEFTIHILPERPDVSSENFRFYEIECDLSDQSGETQTSSLMLPIRQKPVLSAQFPEMLISDGNQWLNQTGVMQFFLDGETNDTLWRDTRTEMQFFRIADPIENSPYADGLKYGSPDGSNLIHYMEEPQFRKLLPDEAYFSLKERDSLAVFTPMLPSLSSLSESGNCTLPADMPAGCYEYRINAYTANNDTLSLKGRFYVVKTENKLPSEMGQDGFFISSNTGSSVYSKEKQIELYVGNSARQPIRINFHLTDIAGNDLSFSKSVASGCSKIELPLNSLSKEGDWSLAAFCQTENQTFFHSFILPIPQEQKEIATICEPLPDKIGSGENIQLHFQIKPTAGGGKPKPIILSMYDASLDMFANGNTTWPARLLPTSPYPQNAWNMGLFNHGSSYGIQTSESDKAYYHAEAGLPGFNARLSWKGLYPVRFNRFLMKNAVMADAAPAMGTMARSEGAVTEESAVVDDLAGDIAQTKTGLKELLPRNDFRPDVFFALAECVPDGNGYSAHFNFRAPDYFGRFKLRSFAYSEKLYAGSFQTHITVNKPLMLYPQLPRFLRENDSVRLKCRYLISSRDFEGEDGLQIQSQIKIVAEDRFGSSVILTEQRQTMTAQGPQGSMQSTIRIPQNSHKLNVEYRTALVDRDGRILATDAVSDSIPVLRNHIQLNEFLPFCIRQGEKKTIKSAFVLPADSIRFSFSGDPYRIVSDQLHDMEFDSCKTALSAAWKMVGYYMCGKDWQSVWPVLSDFSKKKGGFGWIRESEASYFITMQVMTALSMIPQEELMRLHGMHGTVQNAFKFLNLKVSEDFERDTARHIAVITDSKVNFLYLISCWKPYSGFLFRQPAVAYYINLAKQYATQTSLQNQALLLRYFIAQKDWNEAEMILANLNRLALHSKEWGMYWKREDLGRNVGQRVRCMADLACAYMEFACAVENENPNRSDTLASQYREILNWMLNMQQTVDFRSGNAGITTADLVRQAAAFVPKKALSRQMAEKLVSAQTTQQGLVRVQIGKQKFESDTSIFSLNVEPPQTESFKNKTTVEWVGSNAYQVGYGSIKAAFTQEMNSIKPQQDKSGLRIERTYRDLYDTTAQSIPSHNGLRFETGKRIRVSLEIQADRDFSYIRLRSLRPAGLEWLSTQSGYGFENGLSYYKDVDDRGVDYFIEFLPKGRYLLHYELKADTEGIFTDGPATIESDFNGGFGGHSGSGLVIVE